ncbi:MAG: CAP domain-containing protein [Oscillospiraceae bacterium]|nr:CAP domain-containing protein [Oscillospiraceae bacterium]
MVITMKKLLLFLPLVLTFIVTACMGSIGIENIENDIEITSDTYVETETAETTTSAPPITTNTVTTTTSVTTATSETVTVSETTPIITEPPATEPPEPPPPPPEPVYNSFAGDIAWEILGLVNAERAAAGIHGLSWDENFAYTARIRASEIIELFSADHKRPDGREWYTVIVEAGISYRSVGENMARGGHSVEGAAWYSPAVVMDGWMNSPGHRANILNSNFDYLGVGVVDFGGTRYYVQHFGTYL